MIFAVDGGNDIIIAGISGVTAILVVTIPLWVQHHKTRSELVERVRVGFEFNDKTHDELAERLLNLERRESPDE